MARVLFFTSDLYLSGVEKKELLARFINPHLCEIQEDFVFANPFMDSEEKRWNLNLDAEVQAIWSNGELKTAIAEVKEAYMTQGRVLILSDFHTGSIMLNETDTRVIDPEFTFFGLMGFDVGAVVENLVLIYRSNYDTLPILNPEQTIRPICWIQCAVTGTSLPGSLRHFGLRTTEGS